MNENPRRYAAVSGGFVATVLLVVLVLSLIVGAGEGIQYTSTRSPTGASSPLMALGLSLLFSVMGLMNFAYGELIMAGAYTMFFTRSWGWLGMILMTILIVTILSLLMELIAFRPVRSASPVVLLITSFAVSYGIQQLAWTDVFGLAHCFDSTIGTGPQKGVEPYPWLTNQFDIGGVLISRLEIATFDRHGRLLARHDPPAQEDDARHPAAGVVGGLPDGPADRGEGELGDLRRFRHHRCARGRGVHPLHPAHRRRLARHRPGATVRRLRRRGDRRSREPRRRSARRLRPRAQSSTSLQATPADHARQAIRSSSRSWS